MPIETPETFTLWPGSKVATVTSSPTLVGSSSRAEVLVAELDQVAHRRRRPAFFRWPSSALVSLPSLDLAEGELDGVVAVALGVADRGHLAGAGLDHGHGDDGAVLEEDLGHAELLAEDRGHH